MYEFYSSLKLRIDERDNILDYILRFRLHGEPCEVTPKELAQWLKCDCEGMLNTLRNFN